MAAGPLASASNASPCATARDDIWVIVTQGSGGNPSAAGLGEPAQGAAELATDADPDLVDAVPDGCVELPAAGPGDLDAVHALSRRAAASTSAPTRRRPPAPCPPPTIRPKYRLDQEP